MQATLHFNLIILILFSLLFILVHSTSTDGYSTDDDDTTPADPAGGNTTTPVMGTNGNAGTSASANSTTAKPNHGTIERQSMSAMFIIIGCLLLKYIH